MSDRLHTPPDHIPVSIELIAHLPNLSPAALKVYLLLTSHNRGQPVTMRVPAISSSTGLCQRSVLSGLKSLRECGLITHLRGRGKRPNSYSFPNLSTDAKSVPAAERTPSEPRPAEADSPRPGAALPATKSALTAGDERTLRHRIACIYRPLTDQEFTQLRMAEPDEAVLRQKLLSLQGVPRTFAFHWFAEVVQQAVY